MKWYLETGPEGDVVISSRIRLARNIADFPFPCKLTPDQRKTVTDKAREALLSGGNEIRDSFEFIDMQKLTPARAMSLAEKHLVSPEFAQQRDGRSLLLRNDESVSIMLCEEDHIRIQTLFAGQRLEEALELAGRIDDLFDERLRYAFDENLGFLTQCPTNLGTGLRASLMLHLPAIAQSGALPGLTAAVAKLGLTVRGTYGEGSTAKGAFYQISNQVTLGISEREAVDSLNGIAGQIITQERAAREALKKYGPALEDKIWRSYGLLTNARMLSADEFMSLISDVRLGVTMGIIKDKGLDAVNALLCETQPATLMTAAGRNLDASARDALRAQTVRERLA
jgi:protein arginine kinase